MTSAEAKKFAKEWYAAIDRHEPVLTLIQKASPDLVVKFPGSELDLLAYSKWYSEDIYKNFNGCHEIHSMKVSKTEEGMEVYMEITWRASTWTPPEPKSQTVCLKPNVTLGLVEKSDGTILLKSYQVTDRED